MNDAIQDRIDEILLDASLDEDDGYCLVCVRPYHGHGPHVRWGELRWLRADPATRDVWTNHYIPSVEEMLNAAIQMYGDLAMQAGPELLDHYGYRSSADE